MAAVAFAAGLLAALFWGVVPVVMKRGFSYGGRPMGAATVVVVTGFVMLWGAVLLTQGPTGFAPGLGPGGYAVFLAAGFVGTALGRITNFTGIDRVGASVNSAVVSTNPLFATVLALVFLGELVSATQGVGVVVVVLGLVALTVSRGGDLSGWQLRDLAFPLVAALAYGSGAVIRRFGLTTTSASALEGAALNETAALVGVLAYVLAREGRSLLRLPARAVGYFAFSGVFNALGLLMLFFGLDVGRVAIVITLSGTSTLFATMLSALFLGDIERVTRGVALGALLVVAGAAMITLL